MWNPEIVQDAPNRGQNDLVLSASNHGKYPRAGNIGAKIVGYDLPLSFMTVPLVWYLSSKVCRAALIIKHLSVFESNFVGFGSCLFKLLSLSTSQARILEEYQAYHIIYQIKMSSMNLILVYRLPITELHSFVLLKSVLFY